MSLPTYNSDGLNPIQPQFPLASQQFMSHDLPSHWQFPPAQQHMAQNLYPTNIYSSFDVPLEQPPMNMLYLGQDMSESQNMSTTESSIAHAIGAPSNDLGGVPLSTFGLPPGDYGPAYNPQSVPAINHFTNYAPAAGQPMGLENPPVDGASFGYLPVPPVPAPAPSTVPSNSFHLNANLNFQNYYGGSYLLENSAVHGVANDQPKQTVPRAYGGIIPSVETTVAPTNQPMPTFGLLPNSSCVAVNGTAHFPIQPHGLIYPGNATESDLIPAPVATQEPAGGVSRHRLSRPQQATQKPYSRPALNNKNDGDTTTKKLRKAGSKIVSDLSTKDCAAHCFVFSLRPEPKTSASSNSGSAIEGSGPGHPRPGSPHTGSSQVIPAALEGWDGPTINCGWEGCGVEIAEEKGRIKDHMKRIHNIEIRPTEKARRLCLWDNCKSRLGEKGSRGIVTFERHFFEQHTKLERVMCVCKQTFARMACVTRHLDGCPACQNPRCHQLFKTKEERIQHEAACTL